MKADMLIRPDQGAAPVGVLADRSEAGRRLQNAGHPGQGLGQAGNPAVVINRRQRPWMTERGR